MIGKVCHHPIIYVTVFHLILAKRMKHCICGDESLTSKVVFRSQIYLAKAKLRLISDQARDLVKNCFEGWPL